MHVFRVQAPAVRVQIIFMLMRRASIVSRGGIVHQALHHARPKSSLLVPCTQEARIQSWHV